MLEFLLSPQKTTCTLYWVQLGVKQCRNMDNKHSMSFSTYWSVISPTSWCNNIHMLLYVPVLFKCTHNGCYKCCLLQCKIRALWIVASHMFSKKNLFQMNQGSQFDFFFKISIQLPNFAWYLSFIFVTSLILFHMNPSNIIFEQ